MLSVTPSATPRLVEDIEQLLVSWLGARTERLRGERFDFCVAGIPDGAGLRHELGGDIVLDRSAGDPSS